METQELAGRKHRMYALSQLGRPDGRAGFSSRADRARRSLARKAQTRRPGEGENPCTTKGSVNYVLNLQKQNFTLVPLLPCGIRLKCRYYIGTYRNLYGHRHCS